MENDEAHSQPIFPWSGQHGLGLDQQDFLGNYLGNASLTE